MEGFLLQEEEEEEEEESSQDLTQASQYQVESWGCHKQVAAAASLQGQEVTVASQEQAELKEEGFQDPGVDSHHQEVSVMMGSQDLTELEQGLPDLGEGSRY
jgi:hypothetical protein